jgi:hypothetical protein
MGLDMSVESVEGCFRCLEREIPPASSSVG